MKSFSRQSAISELGFGIEGLAPEEERGVHHVEPQSLLRAPIERFGKVGVIHEAEEHLDRVELRIDRFDGDALGRRDVRNVERYAVSRITRSCRLL